MAHTKYETDYLYDYNISDYHFNQMHDGFLAQIDLQVIIFALVLDIWTLITNLIVVYVNVTGRNTKISSYDAQLVNLTVTNLIIAVYVIPLTIHHMFGSWNIGNFMCQMYIAADIIVPFTSIIIIIILTIDRIMAFSHPYLYNWMFETSCCKVVIILPWLTSFLIIVPFWSAATIPYYNQPGECMVMMNTEAAIACPFITFFIPFVVLLVLIVTLIVKRCKYISLTPLSTRESEATHSDVTEDHGTELIGTNMDAMKTNILKRTDFCTTTYSHIVTQCLLSAVFCLLWLPYQSQNILFSFCHKISCVISPEMIQLFTWLGTSTAGIIPLIILVDRYTRDCSSRCNCFTHTRRHVHFSEISQTEVTYV